MSPVQRVRLIGFSLVGFAVNMGLSGHAIAAMLLLGLGIWLLHIATEVS
jgi:hypothetical protein